MCKLCKDFYSSKYQVFDRDPHLRDVYDENFKNDHARRRAFIIRSHAVGRVPGETLRWIQKQPQAIRRQRNSSKSKTQPDFVDLPVVIQPVPDKPTILHRNITDGPSVQWNDAGTDMNPVATLTQEHPTVISQGKTVYVALSSCEIKSVPHQAPPQRGLTPLRYM